MSGGLVPKKAGARVPTRQGPQAGHPAWGLPGAARTPLGKNNCGVASAQCTPWGEEAQVYTSGPARVRVGQQPAGCGLGEELLWEALNRCRPQRHVPGWAQISSRSETVDHKVRGQHAPLLPLCHGQHWTVADPTPARVSKKHSFKARAATPHDTTLAGIITGPLQRAQRAKAQRPSHLPGPQPPHTLH